MRNHIFGELLKKKPQLLCILNLRYYNLQGLDSYIQLRYYYMVLIPGYILKNKKCIDKTHFMIYEPLIYDQRLL